MGLGFQDSSCFVIGELVYLHDHIMVIMRLVLVLVIYLFFLVFSSNTYYKYLSEGTVVEVIWSVVPALLLVFLIFPSIKVLYLMEDVKSPVFSFKVVAHQWYWTYAVPFYKNMCYKIFGGSDVFSSFEYDSIMDKDNLEHPRLLGCDRELFLPVGVIRRLLITSVDVIHCFAVPSLGLKVDALPGRINQLFVNPSRVGVYYGECSEICGSNHSFIPIFVKVCRLMDFDTVRKTFLSDFIADEFDTIVCI